MIKEMNKKTPFIIAGAVAVAIIAGVLIYVAYANAQVSKWNDLIYPGLTIGNVDVSGKTKDEALELVEAHYNNELQNSIIKVKAEEKEFNLELGALEIKYNLEEAVNSAYSYGKDLSIFSKYSLIKDSKAKNIETTFTYNKEKVSEFVKSVADEVNQEAVNATIKISGGKITITPDTTGYVLDTENLEKQLHDKLVEENATDNSVQAVVQVAEASITDEQLSKVDGKISSYTTNYSSSAAGRANNINLSAKAINGTLLMPGDVFSYNGVVGQRTTARGYQEAGVYVGDKVEQGIGGGICQTSSTLYMAAMRANLRSVSRKNHSMPVSYMPLGCDATVDWGNIDYQFKNNYDFPVYIETITANRNLTINIYGSKSAMEGKTYELVGETVQTNTPTIKTIEDPTMAAGTEQWETKPVTGYVVKTYLITYQNGNQVNKEQISTDTYRVVNGVLRKGTKAAQKPVETPTQPTEPVNPQPSEPVNPQPSNP